MTSKPAITIRVEAAERLAALFRIERFVYLAVTLISFLLLVGVALQMISQKQGQVVEWGMLFGSTGLITVTANRVLQMWSQSLRMVSSEANTEATGESIDE